MMQLEEMGFDEINEEEAVNQLEEMGVEGQFSMEES